jgi:type VI secretion system protein ImpG
VFPGYALMQEYFTLKERFLFVDLHGLDRAVANLKLEGSVELTIAFNRQLESYPRVAAENVRLHCVPIANLFPHSAEPLRLRHDRVRYLVLPDRTGLADRRHAEIHSLERVTGVVRSQDLAVHEFKPFHAFAHVSSDDPRSVTYYQMHLEPSALGDDARWGTDTQPAQTDRHRATATGARAALAPALAHVAELRVAG